MERTQPAIAVSREAQRHDYLLRGAPFPHQRSQDEAPFASLDHLERDLMGRRHTVEPREVVSDGAGTMLTGASSQHREIPLDEPQLSLTIRRVWAICSSLCMNFLSRMPTER
jgi:hypothetical protein